MTMMLPFRSWNTVESCVTVLHFAGQKIKRKFGYHFMIYCLLHWNLQGKRNEVHYVLIRMFKLMLFPYTETGKNKAFSQRQLSRCSTKIANLQTALLQCRFTEALVKKPWQTPMTKLIFSKVAGLQSATLLKNELLHL